MSPPLGRCSQTNNLIDRGPFSSWPCIRAPYHAFDPTSDANCRLREAAMELAVPSLTPASTTPPTSSTTLAATLSQAMSPLRLWQPHGPSTSTHSLPCSPTLAASLSSPAPRSALISLAPQGTQQMLHGAPQLVCPSLSTTPRLPPSSCCPLMLPTTGLLR